MAGLSHSLVLTKRFPWRKTNRRRRPMIRTEVASLLLVLFALFSQPAQAIPVTYQIDYTLLDGGPKPLSTPLTFDPGTNLFANLRIVWIPASPASPTAVFFDLLGNNVLGYNINNFSPEARL